MPSTNIPTVYDVAIDVRSHTNRGRNIPGYVITMHVKNRATRVGALSHALGWLKGLERKHVSYLQIQECPGGERCWYETSYETSLANDPESVARAQR